MKISKKILISLCLSAFYIQLSAAITHGSIKGAAVPMYDQGAVGGNIGNAAHTPTLDYKVVTIGSKTWSWIKSNGSYIDTGADWTSQLRYWSSSNAKTESNMVNRNAGSNLATQTWTKTSATMPSPVRLSFFVAMMTGGWSETALINYNPSLKNSNVPGDVTAPVASSCTVTAFAAGSVTLSFSGSDNQGDLFYYITGTGIEEVSFGNNVTLTSLASNTVYTLTVTPVDFSGNEGTPITTTFKTMKSAGVSNIANNLGLNYNSTTTNVSGGEYVSVIQLSGSDLTLGITTASDVITNGGWKNRVLVNPSVRVDGIDYPLTLDGFSTTATITFSGTVGSKVIESGATLSIRWSVYNPGEFFTGTFTYTLGGADIDGPTTPSLSLTGSALSWSASTDAGSGVKSYEISEAGRQTVTIMDLGETTFTYNMINSASTVSVKAVDFVNNKSDAGSVNNGNNFRSKTTGNWEDISTWELSTNNADWVAASAVPTSAAASTVIQNGHLVTITDNATASALYINAGGKLTLNSTKILEVTTFNIQSDATGTGTFIDNGTLTATTTKVEQYLTSGRNWYLSSPVSSAPRSVISTSSSVVRYNEPTCEWLTESSTLTPAKGYIAITPSSSSVITFTGDLNNGTKTIALTRTPTVAKSGFNLVGNPYPSYLNWSDVVKNNIEPTLWYRTKSANSYVFDTYNAVSGIGTSLGLTTVSNRIPPMQAFWVRVLAGQTAATLTFENSMRVHADVVGNRFKAPATNNQEQKVLKIQVSNGTNSDEAIILFNEKASNSYDDYDSPKMANGSVTIPEIYTTIGVEKLVINGLKNVDENTEIPLGFSTGESNSFSIKASEIQNFDENTQIILKDNELNTEKEITDGSIYNFSSGVSNTNNRFSIIFKSATLTTSLDNQVNDKISISRVYNKILINYSGVIDTNNSVIIFNAIGQKLAESTLISSKTAIHITEKGAIVIILNINGRNISRKLIIN